MRVYCYLLIGCLSILFSSVFPASAQEDKEDNMAVFDYAGYVVEKHGKVYFAATYEARRSGDDASAHMQANKPWVKKISKKIKRDNRIDFLELADVMGNAYVRYFFWDNYALEYDFSQPEVRCDGRVLRIELPHDVFTYDNVMKIYKYVLKQVDMSREKPYDIELTNEEIQKLLN